MKQRAGLTLVEVLVAMFIMSIGLLAIMTLFPLGLMNYGQAMQDDRVGQAASNAAAIANVFDLRNDAAVVNPAFSTPLVTSPSTILPSAIFVDPWYAAISPPAPRLRYPTIGGSIPRVGVFTTSQQNVPFWPAPYQQWFSLPDDYDFGLDGTPLVSGQVTGQGSVKNQGYYTWTYLLRRTPGQTSNPCTDMAIVVYKGRVTQSLDGEDVLLVTGSIGQTGLVVLPQKQQAVPSTTPPIQQTIVWPPAIRKTGWILDPNSAQFYRVVSITEDALGGYVLEMQTPLKAPPSGNLAYYNNAFPILVMENVAEVMEKGLGR